VTDVPAEIAAAPLLGPGDPPPFRWHRAHGRRPWLLVCDHAGRAIPATLGGLGLPVEATWRHIAWDVGAGELAIALAERLDAPALLASYSRLVVDCNRRLEDATAFTTAGDGHRIPGNEALSPAERERRAAACHRPYHAAIEQRLASWEAGGATPTLVAVHSFTPVFRSAARPWHVGVLWDEDERIALPLLARLRAERGLVVGDNEPYSGRFPADYTVWRHAGQVGRPTVCVEVRQDLLLTPTGIAEWADRLATALVDACGALS
jgi:predicted N-formylglutamate amidohydrolase